MPKNPTLIEPIDTSFNNLTKATIMTSNKAADPKTFDREALRDKTKGIVPKNGQLSLLLFHSEIHIENQGIEMGILESALRFALAVLKVSSPGSLINDKDGSKKSLIPGETLIKEKE
jgi:hypothetical protein